MQQHTGVDWIIALLYSVSLRLHKSKLWPINFCIGIAGSQFQGVSGGNHTVVVESTSRNGLKRVITTDIIVRGRDAIQIAGIDSGLLMCS